LWVNNLKNGHIPVLSLFIKNDELSPNCTLLPTIAISTAQMVRPQKWKWAIPLLPHNFHRIPIFSLFDDGFSEGF
jgi:hypothetical protein